MANEVKMTTVENNNARPDREVEKADPNNPEETQEQGRGGFLKDLEGDKMHVLVLFFLYILQGIPLGLINAVPLVLQNKNVPYADQAKFSFSSYPFSMKLLWAPLVDSLYIARFGRRKSWLVPVQYLIGITMIVTSQFVGRMLGESSDPNETLVPDVGALTGTFFFLNFLAATQDVAVDGWALTMLQPKNVGYASTCNSVGQTTGWCLGYILYTVLDGAGYIDLSQFLLFWGIVFLVTTTLIAIFKTEKNTGGTSSVGPMGEEVAPEPVLGLVDTYKVVWKIICHPLIPIVALVLLTFGFGNSAAEAMTNLKMIERGVPKDKIAALSIPMIPVKILFTLFVTRFTVGPRPMNVWLLFYPLRLFFCLLMVVLVWITPMLAPEDPEEESFPTYYYVIVIGIFALHRIAVYGMFVAIMAFFARISDPAIGGTNMTFLNTLANLGNMWPSSFTLWLVDVITWKDCVETPAEGGAPSSLAGLVNENSTAIEANVCYGTIEVDSCKQMGASCTTLTEGFFSLSIACVVIGFIWFVWGFRAIRQLQKVEVKTWRVVKKTGETEEKREEPEKFKYFYCY